jgi:glycolate oxidase FAD binding subunit
MTLQPSTLAELQDAVRGHKKIVVTGGRTKSHAGDDRPDWVTLDTRQLSGMIEYSPDECVFTALAGTPLAEIDRTLGAHNQYLPFDPPFAAQGATLGGTVATGLSGPGRYRYGGVRDFIIGVRVVDGEARVIRSGGKVVKNAAGFLLHHGMVGSLGRFGVLVELSFKVFPRPEARQTRAFDCGSVEAAFAAARRIEALGCDCAAIDFDQAGRLSVSLAGRRAALDGRMTRVNDAVLAGHEARPSASSSSGSDHESGSGSGPESCVKIAGLMDHWQNLHPHVTAAHFMCAGAIAWIWTSDLTALAQRLADARLPGLVIRGPHASRCVGHVPYNEFDERVRRVLDPQNRFCAASDSRR